MLKRFEDEGRPAEDLPFVHWAAQDALARAGAAWRSLLANHPSRGAALFLRLIGAPFGLKTPEPDDRCAAAVAALMQTHGPARDRLIAGSWTARVEIDPIAVTLAAFELYPQVEAIERRLKDAMRSGVIARAPQNLTLLDDWAVDAQGKGLITAQERELIGRFAAYADQAIQVDDFAPDFDIAAGLARRPTDTTPAKTKKKAA